MDAMASRSARARAQGAQVGTRVTGVALVNDVVDRSSRNPELAGKRSWPFAIFVALANLLLLFVVQAAILSCSSTDDRARSVRPGLALCDVAGHDGCDSESLAERDIGLSTRRSFAQVNDLSLGELGAVVVFTVTAMPENFNGMFDVLGWRRDLQIRNPVVSFDSVFVVDVHVGDVTEIGCADEPIHAVVSSGLLRTIDTQADLKVSVIIWCLFEQRAGFFVVPIDFEPDVTVARNRVDVFKSRDRFPSSSSTHFAILPHYEHKVN